MRVTGAYPTPSPPPIPLAILDWGLAVCKDGVRYAIQICCHFSIDRGAVAVLQVTQRDLTNLATMPKMEHHQIDLVQRSFARAAKVAPHVAATFYSELFAIEPSLRALFKGDMVVQGEKLMNMLAQVVDNLHQPETILPAVRGWLAQL